MILSLNKWLNNLLYNLVVLANINDNELIIHFNRRKLFIGHIPAYDTGCSTLFALIMNYMGIALKRQ